MKLPRDLAGLKLAKRLEVLGYRITRQTGSHLRLTTEQQGEHHLTIPRHDPLKLGTLASIVNSIAQHFQQPKETIADKIFN